MKITQILSESTILDTQDVAEGLSEMDNRTLSGDRREQRANSPEAKAWREKQQQKRLKNLLECLNWMESATLESVLKKQKDNFPVNLDLLKKSYPDIFK